MKRIEHDDSEGTSKICMVCFVLVLLALVLMYVLTPWFVTVAVAALAVMMFVLALTAKP